MRCWFWPREISMAIWEVGSKQTTLMAAADPLLVWNPRQLVRGQATNTDLGHATACWPAVAATTSPSIHPPHHCRCELSEMEVLSGQMFRWLSHLHKDAKRFYSTLTSGDFMSPHLTTLNYLMQVKLRKAPQCPAHPSRIIFCHPLRYTVLQFTDPLSVSWTHLLSLISVFVLSNSSSLNSQPELDAPSLCSWK